MSQLCEDTHAFGRTEISRQTSSSVGDSGGSRGDVIFCGLQVTDDCSHRRDMLFKLLPRTFAHYVCVQVMKVLLLCCALLAVCGAVPPRPGGFNGRYDPRFARRTFGRGGSGYGPMGGFRRPPRPYYGNPWHRDRAPRPVNFALKGHVPVRHPQQKMQHKQAPTKRTHVPAKHAATPKGHHIQKIAVHKSAPHKSSKQVSRPKHPDTSKTYVKKVLKSLFPKKFAPPPQMKPGSKPSPKRLHAQKRVLRSPHGPPKLVYVYVPYCPKRQPFGRPNIFAPRPLLPRYPPQQAYSQPPNYVQTAYEPYTPPIRDYVPDYEPIDTKTNYEPSTYYEPLKSEYLPSTYPEAIQYPEGTSSDIYPQPTSNDYEPSNYNSQSLYQEVPIYNSANYAPQPSTKNDYPAASDETVNFVEPVGFSKTEKHYSTMPAQYNPLELFEHSKTSTKPPISKSDNSDAYSIPGIEQFQPDTSYPNSNTVKAPFPDLSKYDSTSEGLYV